MAKQKEVNYTAEMVESMVAIYTAAGDAEGEAGDAARQAAIEAIQAETGKSIHSIRAKLGQVGVYIAKGKPKAKGTNRVTKAKMIAQVADAAGKRNPAFFDSLEGATKDVIDYIINLQGEIESLRDTIDEMAIEAAEAAEAAESAEQENAG